MFETVFYVIMCMYVRDRYTVHITLLWLSHKCVQARKLIGAAPSALSPHVWRGLKSKLEISLQTSNTENGPKFIQVCVHLSAVYWTLSRMGVWFVKGQLYASAQEETRLKIKNKKKSITTIWVNLWTRLKSNLWKNLNAWAGCFAHALIISKARVKEGTENWLESFEWLGKLV